ncbi:MAG: DUF5615 family PIN-like protein [Chloroflexota bacterium]|nr:DUF5615 family PIN-like protein [Chloroflexota bacterium]
MKFKIDENLPVEIAELLRSEGHNASTVFEQDLVGSADLIIANTCKQEERVIVTLDLDFADIHAYPPQRFLGIIVLRIHHQNKYHVISVFRRVIDLLGREPLDGRLWIVEESQVRIRGGERNIE